LVSAPETGAFAAPAGRRPAPSRPAAPEPQHLSAAADLEQAFVTVADKAGPAVVSITSEFVQTGYFEDPFDNFYRFFYGLPSPRSGQREFRQRGGGSGFIVSPDGYILTNAHVVSLKSDDQSNLQYAKVVKVLLTSHKEHTAKVVGLDPMTDVAVLKIKPEADLPVLPLGDSDQVMVGQWSIAIGNPFGLENTLTVGVISAKGRKVSSPDRASALSSYIQTDASINSGNSGGPLINIRGEAIGINSMIASPSGGSVGIGFAIPINIAREVMNGIIKEGRITRAQIGVAFRPLAPAVAKRLGLKPGQGLEISQVLKGSGAEAAGLTAGDILLSVDDKPLEDANDLRGYILGRKPGDRVKLEVFRKGKRLAAEVVLKETVEAAKAPKDGGKAGDREKPDASKAWLGMRLERLTSESAAKAQSVSTQGVMVSSVEPGSLAAQAGIQAGDVIREVEQTAVASPSDLSALVKSLGERDGWLLLIERQGSAMYVMLGARPEEGDGE
jgi:Do/DeqQ family serine protease